jgi:hypothetical protein
MEEASIRTIVRAGEKSKKHADALGADGADVMHLGNREIEFALFKRFPIRESKSIELRTEFFNLFNHANLQILSVI